MSIRDVNGRNSSQNYYNLLIISLATDCGWLPAANFTHHTSFVSSLFSLSEIFKKTFLVEHLGTP